MLRKSTSANLLAAFAFAFMWQNLEAQDLSKSPGTLQLVKRNAVALGLTEVDIKNSQITDAYVDALTGNTLVYLQQTHQGIKIDKVIQVLAFKNGTLVSRAGERIDLQFMQTPAGTAQKKVSSPAVTAEDAVNAAAKHLNLAAPSIAHRSAASDDPNTAIDFGDLGISKDKVTARLLWIQQKTFERIKLVWEVNISPKKSSDMWRVFVDAHAGTVIRKENYNVPDNWERITGDKTALQRGMSINRPRNTASKLMYSGPITSITYRVVPFSSEAPNYPNGAPVLVTNPWELSPAGSPAVPFIWNDDGNRQYRYTRGNNVLSQEDENGNDGAGARAMGVVHNNHLYFDFVPDFSKPPGDSMNIGAAMTNLFYWNNIMHDLSYQYGFDEPSGNFQQNNLGRGGNGYDYVFADAQDGISFNNANFGTPPDGHKPRMQMFLWNGDPAKGMRINSPSSIAGRVVAAEGSLSNNNFLNDLGPVTGDVVLYQDEGDILSNGCSAPGNSSSLNGKIALINRGICAFTSKILNAQNAGAIAVIVINNVPGQAPITMGGYDGSITIPAVMVTYETGMKIQAVLSAGTPVNVTLLPVPPTDGDLDNGVICHEYGHGISNRLTGGPSTTACLFNAEQMGEGWSDYISLMTITDWTTARKKDGSKPRTIGTYVLNQTPGEPGIRQYPYSTDMDINPHTYADIAATGGEPHAIGEIWTAVLWDMTWFIIEDAGINPDIFNPEAEGGNSIAYKLVMEGMKLQPCSPGFIDGRDAILKADTLLYNGKYSCAIWKAFARRGMGLGASQGSAAIAGDEIPDFKLGAVFITKHADKKASPGSDLEYMIGLKAKAVCNGSIQQNYVVTDLLPGNVIYLSSDGLYNSARRTVTFRNIDMNAGDSLTLKLKVRVGSNTSFPDSVYLNDPVSSPQISDEWKARNGKHIAWTTLDFGNYYYYSNDTSVRDEEKLVTKESYIIPGIQTTLSFWHEVASDDFNNGGVVEITTNDGKTWEDLGPYILPGTIGYNETILGNSELMGRKAFAGFAFGTTAIDLSAFAGKMARVRFRYATSNNSFAIPDGGTGWIINNIVLSASASITNTAMLFTSKHEMKGLSTVKTKIKGKNQLASDFVVVKQNAKALLTWHSPVELNNGIYQIEKSTDNGKSFVSIGNLAAASGSEDLHSYDFTDEAPAEGLNLYRLNHISRKGSDYSDVKTLMFDNLKSVTIFPNPAKDRVKISIPGNTATATVKLIDRLGKQIKNYQVKGETMDLNLPVLAPGVYYFNVIKNGSTSIHRLVVE